MSLTRQNTEELLLDIQERINKSKEKKKSKKSKLLLTKKEESPLNNIHSTTSSNAHPTFPTPTPIIKKESRKMITSNCSKKDNSMMYSTTIAKGNLIFQIENCLFCNQQDQVNVAKTIYSRITFGTQTSTIPFNNSGIGNQQHSFYLENTIVSEAPPLHVTIMDQENAIGDNVRGSGTISLYQIFGKNKILNESSKKIKTPLQLNGNVSGELEFIIYLHRQPDHDDLSELSSDDDSTTFSFKKRESCTSSSKLLSKKLGYSNNDQEKKCSNVKYNVKIDEQEAKSTTNGFEIVWTPTDALQSELAEQAHQIEQEKKIREKEIKLKQWMTLKAMDIQRMFRGRRARKQVAHLRNMRFQVEQKKKIELQRILRKKIFDEEVHRQKKVIQEIKCAIRIQSLFRGYRARILKEDMMVQLEEALKYAQRKRERRKRIDFRITEKTLQKVNLYKFTSKDIEEKKNRDRDEKTLNDDVLIKDKWDFFVEKIQTEVQERISHSTEKQRIFGQEISDLNEKNKTNQVSLERQSLKERDPYLLEAIHSIYC